MADFTAATLACSGLALRLDLPTVLVAEVASDDGKTTEVAATAVRGSRRFAFRHDRLVLHGELTPIRK